MSTSQFETIAGTPDHTFSIARCHGPSGRAGHGIDHGVAWKQKTGANLRNLQCPEHDAKLYQTTRSWQNHEWLVIPPATVAAAAKGKNDEKKAAVRRAIAAGTHKLARDLVAGDIVRPDGWRAKGAYGKVVDVEKLTGGKVRITVSRTFNHVASAYDWQLETNAYRTPAADLFAAYCRLTDAHEVRGDQLYKLDPELLTWTGSRHQDAWKGWATDDETCLERLAENRIARLERDIKPVSEGGAGVILPSGSTEERREQAIAELKARKDKLREELVLWQGLVEELRGTPKAVLYVADGVARAYGVSGEWEAAAGIARHQVEEYIAIPTTQYGNVDDFTVVRRFIRDDDDE